MAIAYVNEHIVLAADVYIQRCLRMSCFECFRCICLVWTCSPIASETKKNTISPYIGYIAWERLTAMFSLIHLLIAYIFTIPHSSVMLEIHFVGKLVKNSSIHVIRAFHQTRYVITTSFISFATNYYVFIFPAASHTHSHPYAIIGWGGNLKKFDPCLGSKSNYIDFLHCSTLERIL